MQIFAQGKVKKKLTYGNKEKVQEQVFFANSCYVWLTLIILGGGAIWAIKRTQKFEKGNSSIERRIRDNKTMIRI